MAAFDPIRTVSSNSASIVDVGTPAPATATSRDQTPTSTTCTENQQSRLASGHGAMPVKRKSSGLQDEGLPRKRSSRSATAVTSLIAEEIADTIFQSSNFITDFVLGSVTPEMAEPMTILSRLCHDPTRPGNVVNTAPAHSYGCRPKSYADNEFPTWFCDFANAIHTHATAVPSPPPTHFRPQWVVTRNKTLKGINNDIRRPDFVLSITEDCHAWRDILIVGEHESQRSKNKVYAQLASYADQVFVAQPFRAAVFGVLTSATRPVVSFWRFDRAGAIRSLDMSYETTDGELKQVVACLAILSNAPAHALGFHTGQLKWNTILDPYPLDAQSQVSTELHTVSPSIGISDAVTGGTILHFRELLFTAPGLVCRGTRVWKGSVTNESGTEVEVAIKDSWQSNGRASEGSLYSLARSRGVTGLPPLISHTVLYDINHDVRSTHIPADATTAAMYTAHISTHNRVLARLVLGKTGIPISTPALTPLEIARALLAAAIGHASLFFTGKILHRDLSPNNILACTTPLPLPQESIPGLHGHQKNLFGCIIDLDYALDTLSASASGAKDRTGTYPYIAINVLLGLEPHRYRHDLESLLYVLLSLALYPRTKPRTLKKEDQPLDCFWEAEDPLKVWKTGTIHQVADNKQSRIVSSTTMFEALLQHFRPGFAAFRNAARRLRRVLWHVGVADVCGVMYEKQGKGITKPHYERTSGKRTEGNPGRGKRRKEKRPAGSVRSYIRPNEVRVGVDDWQGYLEVRQLLEHLVEELEGGEVNGESEDGSDWETDYSGSADEGAEGDSIEGDVDNRHAGPGL
ncbi:hypothetical protein L211DRAFT_841744 [Terfezia boudieri ATCC MYA-4762]|uniref:Fungal-type protein kinase domain-containing protein n=1 Tax=Terfezia boudieri ATCC MYA-4762 TaxID=1051890 RepID=A0A3N4LFC8_9PEZI|nr:hypothetical protein L211DRAFT_841744 [Terfezia boudieri ATCC MYA-4762]